MEHSSTGSHLWPSADEPKYKIDWSGTQYSVNFIVTEVSAWYEDGSTELADKVLDGFIKWDGCANISYGELYQHFCGVKDLQAFCQLQVELYAKAAAVMTALGCDYPDRNAQKFLIGAAK